MDLLDLPRQPLAHLPTPLEPMPRLSRALGHAGLLIKRDDCTGLATGGNKTRKLEFLLADALVQGADTLVTMGARQSNHCRQTAAAAARAGLGCVLLLEQPFPSKDPNYLTSGNLLLDRIMGAEVVFIEAGCDPDVALDAACARLRAQGHRPYAIPVGGSNALGALGYVGCALEILAQLEALRLQVDRIVLATGSTGTHAGVLAGLLAGDSDLRVTGISVSGDRQQQEEKVLRLARATAELMQLDRDVPAEAVHVDDRFVGPGYGIPTPEMIEAVTLCARGEGVLLDPVYTGKAMAGLIHMVRSGAIGPDERVLFLHTGGAVGLFAYPEVAAF